MPTASLVTANRTLPAESSPLSVAIESVLEQYAIVDGEIAEDLIVLRAFVSRIEAAKERRVKLRALATELEARAALEPRRARRERSHA